ncbi:MAG TPA: M1 family aminopeptidase [Vicinamibacterales bacterium]|nr:M1 family aminopeptidase [Vicinamibacterales bacterium]
MTSRVLLMLACLSLAWPAAAQPPTPPDAIEKLVVRLEQAMSAGDRAAMLALAVKDTDASTLDEFAAAAGEKPTRVVIKERDRQALDGGKQQLLVEVFVERGIEGSLATWRIDLRPPAAKAGPDDWLIERLEPVSNVAGLFRLTLNTTRQFEVRSLVLTGTDVTIEMPTGVAFVAEVPDGPTAVVLLGRGRMHFTPPDEAEHTQLRIFAGTDDLTADFDAAFVRIRPGDFQARFKTEQLVQRAVVPGDLRRASEVFEEFIGRTLQIDLTDLSRDRWSLVPTPGDLIAEVRTRRFGTLTYARSGNEAEDITIFDRRRRRNISLYASAAKLATRGRFYSEDDLVDYDVLAYDIDASISPDRYWINGVANLRIKVRASAMTTITLKLAEALTVRGVYAPGAGRLLHLRVVNQNNLIVNLPAPMFRDNELMLRVAYSGRLEPSEMDREAIALGGEGQTQQQPERELPTIPLEPRYIYSNNSYWYPQSTVSDYALATLRITVPNEYEVVASGVQSGPPRAVTPAPAGQRPQKTFLFQNDRPVRYLSCVISRFNIVPTSTGSRIRASSGSFGDPRVAVDAAPADDALRTNVAAAPGAARGERADEGERTLELSVKANPRQVGRARVLAEQANSILQFYSSIVGEAPYPSFTLAVTENEVPGGHSPAYFAVLNQVLPNSPVVWRNDPVNFESFPSFYIAHELAHQWWGQAVGWKNYHEQWLSEGFAQYFAALYAEKQLGGNVFDSVLRQMRRSAIETSPQGPIYLGYRLGHIRGERPVFRALVYNKAAMVLHMLRRLVGDDPFFWGMRRFYAEWRFKKAGTDDFRAAMEATSGRDLGAFFEAWIHGADIPRVGFSYRSPDANTIAVKFEHRGDVAPVPITVTVTYMNGETDNFVIAVTEKTVERTLTLKPKAGAIRKVEANEDNGALVEIERAPS